MIDPLAAFIAFLKSNATLNTLVGGRIRGVPPGLSIPQDIDQTTQKPKKSIGVQLVDAGIGMQGFLMMPQYYLIAYATSANEAMEVMRSVYGALYAADGQLRDNIMISDRWFMFWANMETGPAPNIEPQSNWPVAYATVRAKFNATKGA
jgi:hypothetical protein